MAVKTGNEKLQAILLGHVVRKQILHQLREEYERTVQEVRTGSCLPLANQVVHWPKKNALCYPVFKDQAEEISEHHVHGFHGYHTREGNKSSSPGMCESSNILSLERQPIACGDEAEIHPTVTVSGHGLEIAAAAKHAGTSDFHSDTLLSVLDSQGAGRLTYDIDQTSTLPSTTTNIPSVNEQIKKQPPLVQDHVVPSVPVPYTTATVAAADSQPQLKSGFPQLEGDTVRESCLESSGLTFPDLPQDRESLMELRAQLAVELLWIKQAIASRQNYLKLREELKDGTS